MQHCATQKLRRLPQYLFNQRGSDIPASAWELLQNIINRYNINTVLVNGCREVDACVAPPHLYLILERMLTEVCKQMWVCKEQIKVGSGKSIKETCTLLHLGSWICVKG